MSTQIFLIRHGETQWSASGQHTSHTDLPLTEEGERQAARLRSHLVGIRFSHVLTSPLQRARRTCELTGFGALAKVDPDLQEWNYGDYEGRTSAEIHRLRPGWNVFQEGCPGGESVEQMALRTNRVLARLRLLDGTIALFSHGQFLRSLAVRWIELPVRNGQHLTLDPAAVSVLGYDPHDGEVPIIFRWNLASP